MQHNVEKFGNPVRSSSLHHKHVKQMLNFQESTTGRISHSNCHCNGECYRDYHSGLIIIA